MSLTVIVATKNEAEWIENCLLSANFADEIVVLDSGSTDKTKALAQKLGAKVVEYSWQGFKYAHEYGAKQAQGDWLFYLDADERISSKLRDSIIKELKQPQHNAYQVKRKNYIMGQPLTHGGWYPDKMTRLIKKSALVEWVGELHEYPKTKGTTGFLDADIYHLTHRSMNWKLQKSQKYTLSYAQLLFESGHPPVKVKNFFGAMTREFYYRAIKEAGWKDGFLGWLEIIDQTYNAFLVQAQLWQLQQKKSLDQTYKKIDQQIKQEISQ